MLRELYRDVGQEGNRGSDVLSVVFREGTPPDVGNYLVTDGEEIGIDSWWEYIGFRCRLPSDVGKPGDDVHRRWSKYENVIGWAPLILGQNDD